MKKGELHKTIDNQHRAILGTTPSGDIAFATRGGNVSHDYNSCQIQAPKTFANEAEFVGVIPKPDFDRIKNKFKNYMESNDVQ